MYELSPALFKALMIYSKGILAGLIVSIPLGPASVIAIRRTLNGGLLFGLISALGIVIADTVWGSITSFGLTPLLEGLMRTLAKLRLFSGAALIIYGTALLIRPFSLSAPASLPPNLGRSFLITLGITLVNPFIPLLFTATFTSIGLEELSSQDWTLVYMNAGIFSGALLWWCLLCSLAALLQTRLKSSMLMLVNRLSGLLLIGFGFYVLMQAQEWCQLSCCSLSF